MTIKAFLLGAVASAVFAGPALTADMPYPVQERSLPVVPDFSWSGFYLGGNAGYGWGKGSAPWMSYLDYYYAASDAYGYTGSSDSTGWFGGFQFGYNHELGNGFVLGAEADFQFGSLKDTLNYSTLDTSAGFVDEDFGAVTTRIEAFGSVRGRLGYAFDRLMPYATAGLAWGSVKVSETWDTYFDGVYQPSLSGHASVSETLWGWTVGGGVEYAVTDNWTLRGEYLYTDLGDISWDGDASTHINVRLQNVKIGVNYKF